MTIRSTSLEPKSQLTINLALKRKKKEEKKKRRKKEKRIKFPIKRVGESKNTKKGRKFQIKDRKKIEEICRKVFRPNDI